MAAITAQMVKELRERTGAGMMDCKNALVEADGDPTKAIDVIQKKGLAKAVKAAGRIAADGMVVAKLAPGGGEGVLVEVNCQTDFVARGDEFKQFAETVATQALATKARDVATLEGVTVEGKTLREHAEVLTAKSGEKHAIRRVERFETDPASAVIASYIHHGARLGVMVELAGGATPALREFADEIALQIASMGPKFVRKEDAPQDAIAKQREIFTAQMKTEDDETVAAFEDFKRRMAEEGGDHSEKVTQHLATLEKKAKGVQARPAAAREKILDGKVAKWLTEIVLLDQVSVKDSGKTIAQLVADASKSGAKVEIKRFARFELGEGIDKGPAKDFATEVAEMTAASQRNA